MTPVRSAPPETTRHDDARADDLTVDDLLAGTEYASIFDDEPAVTVHPRFAQRLEVVERTEFRARSRRQLALLAATVLGLLLVVAWQSGLVTVRQVDVTGSTHTDADVVRRTAALNGAASLLWLDTAGAARRVESLPWVAAARVERHWPGRVTVQVTEQQPAAFVTANGVGALVGPDDRVLERVAVAPAGLPHIVGVRVPGVGERLSVRGLGLLAASLPPSMRAEVREIRAADPRSIAIELTGTEVRIGSADDIATKLASALAVLAAEGDQHCAGHYVDVSTPTTAVAGC